MFNQKLYARTLINALHDLSILAGDVVGHSDTSWQDVAGTAAENLRALAGMLDSARHGNYVDFVSFASPTESFGEVNS